ncbi:MAG: hypothetical protein OYK82_12870 [Gammaproteobacteria bacterium]|nr:hypothetical protein [Gammaproteobacteria bacterium]
MAELPKITQEVHNVANQAHEAVIRNQLDEALLLADVLSDAGFGAVARSHQESCQREAG